MADCHAVAVHVSGPPGTGFMMPLKFFAEQAAAEQFMHESQGLIDTLREGKIVLPGIPGSPPTVACRVLEFVQRLGIQGIHHRVWSSEMQGSLSVPVGPRIILPGA